MTEIKQIGTKFMANINGKNVVRSNRKLLEQMIKKTTGDELSSPTVDTRTDEEIAADIMLRFNTMTEMVLAATKGLSRSLFCQGPAGVGKSTGINKALVKSGADVETIKGFCTPLELYSILYANCSKNNIVLFDDADAIFADEICMNLLKAATDSTSKRIICWRSSKDMYDSEGEPLPSMFEFNGSVIFITNKDFNQEIAKQSKMSCHFEALRSRAHCISLNIHTKREYVIHLKNVIATEPILDHFNAATKKEIVDFIDEHQDKMLELSLRMITKLSDLVKINPKNWKNLAKITLMV